jgi:hypothetical protein
MAKNDVYSAYYAFEWLMANSDFGWPQKSHQLGIHEIVYYTQNLYRLFMPSYITRLLA